MAMRRQGLRRSTHSSTDYSSDNERLRRINKIMLKKFRLFGSCHETGAMQSSFLFCKQFDMCQVFKEHSVQRKLPQ